jgi:GNAT superfamily N-acetyltransferase
MTFFLDERKERQVAAAEIMREGAVRPAHAPPGLEVVPTAVEAILSMREEYRAAMGCQVVHGSYHERGFTDSYLLKIGGEVVGYASVAGDPHPPREIVKELYVGPAHRWALPHLFRALVDTASPRWIEAQTNDPYLRVELFDRATSLRADRVLFEDGRTTSLPPPGVELRRIAEEEKQHVFAHTLVPVGDWALDLDGETVATGGLLFHYNPPYGDIHMEVAAPCRGRGYGAFLVQELKRICYEIGHSRLRAATSTTWPRGARSSGPAWSCAATSCGGS